MTTTSRQGGYGHIILNLPLSSAGKISTKTSDKQSTYQQQRWSCEQSIIALDDSVQL